MTLSYKDAMQFELAISTQIEPSQGNIPAWFGRWLTSN